MNNPELDLVWHLKKLSQTEEATYTKGDKVDG